MQSFKNRIRKPIVEKDIIELEKKIQQYNNREIPEEDLEV